MVDRKIDARKLAERMNGWMEGDGRNGWMDG